jgi:hypothetical protein
MDDGHMRIDWRQRLTLPLIGLSLWLFLLWQVGVYSARTEVGRMGELFPIGSVYEEWRLYPNEVMVSEFELVGKGLRNVAIPLDASGVGVGESLRVWIEVGGKVEEFEVEANALNYFQSISIELPDEFWVLEKGSLVKITFRTNVAKGIGLYVHQNPWFSGGYMSGNTYLGESPSQQTLMFTPIFSEGLSPDEVYGAKEAWKRALTTKSLVEVGMFIGVGLLFWGMIPVFVGAFLPTRPLNWGLLMVVIGGGWFFYTAFYLYSLYR